MKIGIIGLGFVGLSLATVLATKGYKVIGIDNNEKKCKEISNGNPPFYEPNLEKTLKKALKKAFTVSNDFSLIRDCNLIFVTVGTPQKEDGAIELTMIRKSISTIGKNLDQNKQHPIIFVKSTVVPGTMKNVILPILEKKSKRKLEKILD